MAVDLSRERLEKLLTVGEVAKLFEVRQGIVRRCAKKKEVPGAVFVLGRYGFDPDDVMKWTPPDPGTRIVGVRRSDGRQRFSIWLDKTEHEACEAAGYEMSDPRKKAAERKAARTAAAEASAEGTATPDGAADAAVAVSENNPFADFEDEK